MYYQIRLTYMTSVNMWSWTIWEYDSGFYTMKHNPTGGGFAFLWPTASDAFNAATKWCSQNGMRTS